MSRAQDTATAADQLAYVWKHGVDGHPFTTAALRDLITEQWPDLHTAITAVVEARTDNKEGAA